jgi:ribosomal protein S18 acetylase RimI-like enzyme
MIRPATPADEPAIRDCANAAFAPYIPAIGRAPAPMTADHAATIAAGTAHVAVDHAGRIDGFVVFRPEYGAMLLDTVAVRPEAQGRGTGRALIAVCENAARARGIETVRLYTNAKMTSNLALYPRLGYIETDRRTEDGFDRVYFEKSLT